MRSIRDAAPTISGGSGAERKRLTAFAHGKTIGSCGRNEDFAFGTSTHAGAFFATFNGRTWGDHFRGRNCALAFHDTTAITGGGSVGYAIARTFGQIGRFGRGRSGRGRGRRCSDGCRGWRFVEFLRFGGLAAEWEATKEGENRRRTHLGGLYGGWGRRAKLMAVVG